MKFTRKIFFLLAVMTASTSPCGHAAVIPAATPQISAAPPTVPGNQRTVTYSDAVVLGLVEGGTEYLPVSSIGHTILATHALGLDRSDLLLDRSGGQIFISHHGELEPLTLKKAVDIYNVMVQAGPIAAILLLYWRRVWSAIRGALGLSPAGLLLLRNLLVAFVPAGILGFLLEGWIHDHLFSSKTVAGALVAGAFLMLAVEHWRKRRQPNTATDAGPDLHELSWRQALLIGLCQCLSLWPGTSRSMMTIVGGYLVGLRPARAAEFSFLLGLITLTAASGYEALRHGAQVFQGLDWGPLVLGVVIATGAAALAVKWFVGWLARYGLGAFAWYRLALAAVVLAVM